LSEAFALDGRLDPQALRAEYAARGRIEIANFLDGDSATRLREHLLARDDWTLVLNAGDKVYELPRARLGELDVAKRDQLEALVTAAARDGFQFRYETIRVTDDDEERARSGTLLDEFVRFLSSDVVVDFFRTVTGQAAIAFADGQATAYSPGHFLTAHDDDVEGKNRKAAYVFGLTSAWRIEWGGLLMFHGEDKRIDEAFVPAMGALRLFSVPVRHSVSYVAPFAAEPRLSVTGWLRAEADDR
jgi:Rps23 Pro-64 3,4-dihydroxylase Tpa1-like proline 4-hydroxylase